MSDQVLVVLAVVLLIIAALPHKLNVRVEYLAFAALAATLL